MRGQRRQCKVFFEEEGPAGGIKVIALKNAAVWSFQQSRELYLLIIMYLAVSWTIAIPYGIDMQFRLYHRIWWIVNFLLFFPLFIALTLWMLAKTRPARPFHFLVDAYVNDWKLGPRLLLALPPFLILPPMFSAVTSIKHSIKLFNPALSDHAIIKLDYALHGGHPWELLQPIIGFTIVTQVLDLLYSFWFLVMYAVLTWVTLWLKRIDLRNQYLLSFALCWIVLGSFFAVLGASVGPCYFAIFHPGEPDPFSDLMVYLRSTENLNAIQIQSLLLQNYSEHSPGLGRGISAMPSLHVAIAMLQAILGWKVGRWAGILATFYLLAILLGSVHLGWHYAVDGYASMIVVPALWVVAGRIVRSSPESEPALQPAE